MLGLFATKKILTQNKRAVCTKISQGVSLLICFLLLCGKLTFIASLFRVVSKPYTKTFSRNDKDKRHVFGTYRM